MTRRSIYESPVAKRWINDRQIQSIVAYLVRNGPQIVISPDNKREALTRQPISRTAHSQIVNAAVAAGVDRKIVLLNLGKAEQLPEVLSYQHTTLDALQFDRVSPVAARAIGHTDFAGKLIINATPYFDSTGKLSDLPGLQANITRDLLVRSHYTTMLTWVTPDIALQTAKIYTMSLGSSLERLYDLDISTAAVIKLIFLYYYISLVSKVGDQDNVFRNAAQTLFKQHTGTITPIIEEFKKTGAAGPDKITIDTVCEVARELGPRKMSNLSPKIIYTIGARMVSGEGLTGGLAVEYPPYWVYLLTRAASGKKMGLTFTLKKMGLMRDVDKIVGALAGGNHPFISGLMS
jgi:hypothetical protein